MIDIKKWEVPSYTKKKGTVFIVHGMGEYHKRYENLGEYISNNGYTLAMIDHKGHGTNVKSRDELGLITDNFKSSIEEIVGVIEKIRDENENLPLFILGHSMGSFMTQIIMETGIKANGVILSGSVRPMKFLIQIAYSLANFLMKFGNKRNNFLNKLVFGLNNIKFKGNQKFRWLSQDKKSVEMYESDEFCGFVPYTSYFRGLFYIIRKTIEVGDKKDNINMPLYIFSGGDDPVGEYGNGTKKLFQFYKDLGYKDIELKIYPKGRHEMFNEINKKDVYLDLVNWLDRRIK